MKNINQGIYDYPGLEPEGQPSGGPVGPNTVGSEEIIDHSVKRQDIDPELVDALLEEEEVGFIGTDAARSMVRDAIGEQG